MNAIERVAAGDTGALVDLLAKYRLLLYRCMVRFSVHEQDMEDVLNDVIVIVLEKGHTYDAGRGAESTWLYRITRNLILERMARDTRNAPKLKDYARTRERDPVDKSIAEDVENALKPLTPEEAIMLVSWARGLEKSALCVVAGGERSMTYSRIRRAKINARELAGGIV